jgi:hypothetical protein
MIRLKIKNTEDAFRHLLDQPAVDININAPVALMQIQVIARLDVLYWVLQEKRPQYEYDNKGDK